MSLRDARCVHCGKPEDDSKHIRYGSDADNPVKHEFEEPQEAVYTQRELKQKLAEAQAEMVERCAEALSHLATELRIVKDGVSADLAADAIQESTEVIRALSPDPHARERWELEARLDATRWALELFNDWLAMAFEASFAAKYGRAADPDVLLVERLAGLRSQLAALPEEVKQ